jgi:hypothetical protein
MGSFPSELVPGRKQRLGEGSVGLVPAVLAAPSDVHARGVAVRLAKIVLADGVGLVRATRIGAIAIRSCSKRRGLEVMLERNQFVVPKNDDTVAGYRDVF